MECSLKCLFSSGLQVMFVGYVILQPNLFYFISFTHQCVSMSLSLEGLSLNGNIKERIEYFKSSLQVVTVMRYLLYVKRRWLVYVHKPRSYIT